jgi:hypothetical protein
MRWAVVITALVAGISGVLVGFVLSARQRVPDAPVVAPAPPAAQVLRGAAPSALLSATLETSESGDAVTQDGRAVQIIVTFETEDGHYCRAFSSRDASFGAEGVACRNGGHWQMVAWDGTVDLSEGSSVRVSELLDDVIDRLGGGAPLEAAEERALIERHWSAPQR